MTTSPVAAGGSLSSTVGRYRWVICGLLFLATTVNYIDRQILSLVKSTLDAELGWTNEQFGQVNAAFQGAYAIGLLLFGVFIDRVGTKIGYAVSIVAWSLAALGHALVGSIRGFFIARLSLGLGEGGNFPSAIKAVALWFPKRERALATALFNSGTNVGAIIAPAVVPWLALTWGWRSAFVVAGIAGFLWLFLWLPFYDVPEKSTRLKRSEFDHIHSDADAQAAPGGAGGPPLGRIFSFGGRISRRSYVGVMLALVLLDVLVSLVFGSLMSTVRAVTGGAPWTVGAVGLLAYRILILWLVLALEAKRCHDTGRSGWLVLLNLVPGLGAIMMVVLAFPRGAEGSNRYGAPEASPALLGYRQTWSFVVAKFMTDPVWWFFLIWLPDFFKKTRGLDIKSSRVQLVTIYTIVTVLSIFGGWLAGYLIRRGFSANRARKLCMLMFACCVLPVLFVPKVGLWGAVLLIGLAGAAHQAWSANLFTTVSDMFPKTTVASVVGVGGMAGSFGGILFPVFAGRLLDKFHADGYAILFAICGSAYLVAYGINHLLAPKYAPVALNEAR